MRAVAFHIAKGGTGKTSMAGSVAAMAAETGVRTILVDADPQGNVTSWFCTGSLEHDLADVLQGKVETSSAVVEVGTLALLPTAGIGSDLKDYAETKLMREPFVFEELNEALAGLGYDLCVYDLSPGLSMLERAVLLACDEVIPPLLAEYFSADGLEAFTLALENLNHAFRRDVRHERVVVNGVNRSYALHNENLERYRTLPYRIHVVPQDRKLADAQAAHQSVTEYAPGARSIEPLRELTAAVLS